MVVDILPIQLKNLGRKLPADERVALLPGDTSLLACPDAGYDQVLLFFLLRGRPGRCAPATLAEALRVVRPGGRHRRRLSSARALAPAAPVDAGRVRPA